MEKTTIPGWLLEKQEPFNGDSGGCACLRGKPGRRGFVEKTIESIAQVLRDEFFAGQIAGNHGLLQSIDPRVKALTTLLLIIAASLIRHPLTLIVMNLWVLLLAKVSRVPVKIFFKRVWLVVPLFTGIIVLPSIFNIVSPGDPLLTLFKSNHQIHIGSWTLPNTLTITRQGVHGALALILRVGASVSLALILTLTTRWNILLKALNMIFVPQIFISVLEMTYRYIYLLLQTAGEIFVARQSRTVGRASTKEQRRFIGGAMGTLWGKAYNVSEEVHAAMVSRGYTGKPKTLVAFKTRAMDWLWAAFIVLVSLFFLGGDRIVAR
ncbi:cobalt ECF transporter T component CbiQ [Pelotomaculum isophthalicicum JI]|uniref:Cobalt ECF transporter T component CbiQ n=1 Tax=Pelotomaculum isophthalicicum JI TaxID=947010 RepID=A0A9X4H5L3_9FIRM|nr:cobalt ECF transporter T component CbiQ [Pelotomaculum isophthalicicum]MDF9408552.1 cobalt ECF transporter T component CbiQ [Pelotomaculum isophthalicicum JI]